MKNRLVCIGLVVTLLFTVIAGAIPLPADATALASDGGGAGDPLFALIYQKDHATVQAMANAINSQSDDQSAFGQSEVLAQGGFFGSSGAIFHYGQYTLSGYQYYHDYYCVNGVAQSNQPVAQNNAYFKIEVSVLLNYTTSPAFTGVNKIGYSPDYTNISYTPKQGNNQITTEQPWHIGQTTGLSDSDRSDGSPAMPSSCEIPGFYFLGQFPNGLLNQTDFPLYGPASFTTSGGVDNLESTNVSSSTLANWAPVQKSLNATSPPSNSTASSSGASTGPSLTCDLGINFSLSGIIHLLNPLNYILCGLIKGLDLFVDSLNQVIISSLAVGTDGSTDQPNQIFASSAQQCSGKAKACNAYYVAWQSFRDIALGLMVIGGLIMVIANALGMEVLDAYTIRKVLPRLLIVAIGLTLSWQLMEFFVTLTNDLGYGVGQLMYAPFQAAGIDVVRVKGLGGGNGIAETFLGGAFLAAFDFVGLLAFIGTAGLAVLVAVVVLVLRQTAIILLIIVAPIAIVSYILPNTQRIYKVWWESFSKALLMFPLIIAIITAGHIFAAITITDGALFSQIIAFIAYFAPYFLIPATFKLAGGAVRQIGGFVNDRGRGGFDRLRNFRNQRASKNIKKIREGERWNSEAGRFGQKDWMSVGHLANRAAINVFDPDEIIPYQLGRQRGKFGGVPGFKRGSAKLQDKLDNAALEQSTKAYQDIEQHGGMHYEAWRALAGDYNAPQFDSARTTYNGQSMSVSQAIGEAGFIDANDGSMRAPKTLDDFRKLSEIMINSDNDKVTLGGQDLASHEGTLANLKKEEGMALADTQIIGTLGLAAAGRAEPQTLANITNSINDRLGAGVADRTAKQAMRVGQRNRPDLRDGHGLIFKKVIDRNGNEKMTYESAYSDANYSSSTAIGSVTSVKGSDWSSAKAEAVHAAASTLTYVASGVKVAGDNRSEEQVLENQSTIKDAIVQGIISPYNDPGQRSAWAKIATDSKIMSTVDIQKLRAQASRQDLGDQDVRNTEPPADPLAPPPTT